MSDTATPNRSNTPTSKLDVLHRFQTIGTNVIVPFSGGKDSLVTLDLLTRYKFTVHAYHLYIIPNIQFVQTYLASIEKRYNLTFLQLPHPQIAMNARSGYYRHFANITSLKWNEIDAFVRQHFGDYWLASGEKKNDSLQRRGMISVSKGLDPKRRRAFILADWNDHDVYSYIRRQRLPLAPDYKMFGCSWGGNLEAKYVRAIREHYPDDYATILKHYPLLEAILIKDDLNRKDAQHGA